MNKAKRRHLLSCMGTAGMWEAGHRWAKMRREVFLRRYDRGGFTWWARVGYHVSLKPKRGQKR